ncbi:MAG: pentapeptide repeat-containing protein, partial [Pseudomonadota bacterium]
IEVRIGAIYALERIAQDSDRDHVQIMEILCAYIRENAPATEAKDWSKFELQIGEEDGPLRSDWHEQWEAFELLQQHKIEQQKRPRADVQTALTVIGRRSARQRQLEARAHDPNCNNEFVFDIPAPKPEEFFNPRVSEMVQLSEFLDALRDWETQLQSYRGSRLDLRETDLRRADFYGLNFGGADFRFSQMQGAVFFQTQLRGAALLRTGLSWASFSEAQMQAAQLDRAQMQGTRLDAAYMQAALFNEAQMQGADLKDAKLQGASFSDAQMQGAKLGGAQMQGAQLCDTQMQNVRLINIQINEHTSLTLSKLVGACVRYFDDVTITQLKPFWAEMFGDATALPPEAEGRPAHWPDFKMENEEFLGEWRKWQADPDTYCPPKRPKAENDKPTTT